MSYTITVQTTHDGSELVACFLEEAGATGVNIVDAYDLKELLQNKSPIFWDYVDDALLSMDDIVRVCGFYTDKPSRQTIEQLTEQLQNAKQQMPVDMGSLLVEEGESLGDDDWLENWKLFYRPIQIGAVTVLPAWLPSVDGVVVKINPSTAFGTGEHESTKMCLQLLQEIDLADKQVIDVGCGSGILGIAASKLGAAHCYFADLDPDAVKNCRENIALNGVDNCLVQTAPLLQGCQVKGDVILANITADVLLLLAKEILPYQRAGGYLIVSGIIAGREQQVLEAFIAKGYAVCKALAQQDWRAYLLQAQWN